MGKNTVILTNAEIYTEQGIIENGYIKFSDESISKTGSMDELENTDGADVFPLPAGHKVIPGMIDIHIHGVSGADTMDATTEALQTMTGSLPKEGTTSFLATTMTQHQDVIEKALRNAADFIHNHQQPGQAEVIGIHLEGPFLNKGKAGAQPAEHIIEPSVDLFKAWQEKAENHIRLVTLAPEQDDNFELTRYLKQQNVIASIGHSDASFDQTGKAIENGVSHVTHLFNQMRGLHHREPGIVGAALLHDELMVEIISDGIHVHPDALRLAYRQKSSEKLVLITDSMRAKCLKNGSYDLGGQEVIVEDGKALLADGTLAGSVLKMGQAFKNIIDYAGCSISEAIAMSSTNPAKELEIYNRKGSIVSGKDADIVVLDDDNEVAMTFCRGQLAYKKGEGKK